MKPSSTRVGVIAAAIVIGACAPAAPPASGDSAGGSDAVRETIARINRDFPGLMRDGNADSAAAWFAPDAVLYASGAPPVQGRAAIREFYAGLFKAIPIRGATFTTAEITVRDDIAIETGTNALSVAGPGQQAAVMAPGKYLAVWKRQPDGRWLIWRHAPSSDAMPAMR